MKTIQFHEKKENLSDLEKMQNNLIICIAQACHDSNRAWCMFNYDFSQNNWEESPEWQRNSAIQGVLYRLNNPDATPESQHQSWYDSKEKDGWVYGEVKDETLKTHPCMVPYSELPEFQKVKDKLFISIVDALGKGNALFSEII